MNMSLTPIVKSELPHPEVEEPPPPRDPPAPVDDPPGRDPPPPDEPPVGPDEEDPSIRDPRLPGQPAHKEADERVRTSQSARNAVTGSTRMARRAGT
jgi:hypothetical protein